MKIFNQPYDNKVDPFTDINPGARRYKANNIQAFRAMYEIVLRDGDLNSPDFDPNIKTLLEREVFGFSNTTNGPIFGKKLKQFVQVWNDIKSDPRLRAKVSGMLAAFHTTWDEYGDAVDIYSDNEEYPVYMDVAKYLNTIIDEKGEIKKTEPGFNIYKVQDEYSSLASDWRAEINAQYQNYLIRKNNNNPETE